MRNEQEMMKTIMDVAEKDERIRVVTLEGSRTNRNIPKDLFQDYDITFLVEEMNAFLSNESWLDQFGERLMMQKPEDMELFTGQGWGFSYLMMFADYNKMDLTLVPVEELQEYLSRDKLVQVLLDKDNRIKEEVKPTDEDYHIQKPSSRSFDDCCNEFWHVSGYVVKGLCRKEILFAIDHLNDILRKELLRMISWKVGLETGFSLSVGKSYKFLDQYVTKELWEALLETYAMDSYAHVWRSLFQCQKLFREISREVADELEYPHPEYDKAMTHYAKDLFEEYGEK